MFTYFVKEIERILCIDVKGLGPIGAFGPDRKEGKSATKPPKLWPFWKTIQNGSKPFLQHLDHLPKPAGFGNCKDEVNL